MAKLAFTMVAVAALCFAAGENASAQGFHFGGGGVHVDVGYPHGGYYAHPRSLIRYSSCYGGGYGWGGHADWNDTSHYDYHPGGVVRHRNHYHYVPGHYDYHDDGHWDHH